MLNGNSLRPTALALAVAVGLSGCATVDRHFANSSGTIACVTGGLLGAALGAAAGAATKGDAGAIALGAVIGAGAGCGAGLLYQKRVHRLQAIAKEEGMQMQIHELKAAEAFAVGSKPDYKPVGIEAQVQDSEMFPVGSSTLSQEGRRKLTRLALALADKQSDQAGQQQAPVNSKKVLVVGHTDATGSAQFNQKLSEQRARAVGQILADAGIPREDIYYQGAGASRPVSDNTTDQGRRENRRVEFVEVANEKLLVERVRNERSSSKYLTHGTAPTVGKVKSVSVKPVAKSPVISSQPVIKKPTVAAVKDPVFADTSAPMVVSLGGKGGINFGGAPVSNTQSVLAGGIAPKSSSFAFISPAYADAPVSSCIGDMPRVEGEVKSLANDKPLKDYATTEFFPGLNGNGWASPVNGHVVSVGPIAVLRDDGKVAQSPYMKFITNYKTSKKKETGRFQSVANTYEGETEILYRVFATDMKQSPISCMDIVFDKRAGTAVAAEIYYPNQGSAYVAQFSPLRLK